MAPLQHIAEGRKIKHKFSTEHFVLQQHLEAHRANWMIVRRIKAPHIKPKPINAHFPTSSKMLFASLTISRLLLAISLCRFVNAVWTYKKRTCETLLRGNNDPGRIWNARNSGKQIVKFFRQNLVLHSKSKLERGSDRMTAVGSSHPSQLILQVANETSHCWNGCWHCVNFKSCFSYYCNLIFPRWRIVQEGGRPPPHELASNVNSTPLVDIFKLSIILLMV
jgi:hypothetical protein